MKPAPFAYHDPRTLDDLIGLAGRLENAKLLAGGQSLVSMLNMRFVIPNHVIDLNRVASLAGIADKGDAIEIGAMTRQRALERDPVIASKAPVVLEALRQVGHLQTRSRGTFGGSLCHLDPSAELCAVARLYDATLHVAGSRGRRDIAMADWSLGFMTPALEPDEVLTGITLPVWREPHGHAFVELARRHGDFAIAGVGCLVALDGKGAIARAAISIAGIATAPVRLSEAEAALKGQPATPDTFKAAAAHATKLDCLADAHVSAAYRQRLAGVLTERALATAAARAKGAAQGSTHA
jgi:aerobic carbon-monoxide dehydrogenase medium subunit